MPLCDRDPSEQARLQVLSEQTTILEQSINVLEQVEAAAPSLRLTLLSSPSSKSSKMKKSFSFPSLSTDASSNSLLALGGQASRAAALLSRQMAILLIRSADPSQFNYLGSLLKPNNPAIFDANLDLEPIFTSRSEFFRGLRLLRKSAEKLETSGDLLEAADSYRICGIMHRRCAELLQRRGHEFVYSSKISVLPTAFRLAIAKLNSVALSHLRTSVTAVKIY